MSSVCKENVVVSIKMRVEDEKLDSLEEYVYSIRKESQKNAYSDQLLALLNPLSQMKFTMAIKVPNLMEPALIKGELEVGLYRLEQFGLKRPVVSQYYLPQIEAQGLLYSNRLGMAVLNLAIKRNARPEARVGLKNASFCKLDVSYYLLQVSNSSCFEIQISPSKQTLQAGSSCFISLVIKEKSQSQDRLFLNRVLFVKVENSNAMLSFPLRIELYS